MKTLLGLFITIHGLIYFAFFAPKLAHPLYPFYLDRGWLHNLIGQPAQPIGIVLVMIAAFLLIFAGLGMLGTRGLRDVTKEFILIGMGVSLITLILFWQPWLTVGILIDIAFLVGILRFGWFANWLIKMN